VLRPDASLRLVVPDGESYLHTYASSLEGSNGPRFPYLLIDISTRRVESLYVEAAPFAK
jgi:predicted SAM-dependent methyltransferase